MASTTTSSTITIPNEGKTHSQVSCSSVADIIEEAVSKDLKAKRREYLFAPPRWLQRSFLPALQDQRDEPVALLLCNILLITIPSAILVLFGPQRHMIGAIHVVVNYVLLFPRFVVALLHVTEHRRLFRAGISYTIDHIKLPALQVSAEIHDGAF